MIIIDVLPQSEIIFCLTKAILIFLAKYIPFIVRLSHIVFF